MNWDLLKMANAGIPVSFPNFCSMPNSMAVTRHFTELRTPEKIIFNPPATIVIWSDGTKTVVRATKDDTYSPEVGVAMAYMKKIFGSGSGFKKMVKKWRPE